MFRARLLPLFLLSTLAMISSCGNKSASKTSFNIVGSSLVNGTQLPGGILLKGIRYDDTNSIAESFIVELDSDDSAEIPFGTWELHIVGYEGPSAWLGNTYCGSTPRTVLDTAEIEISLTINQSNCANEPFLTIIDEKAGTSGVALWDSAVWDSETWGP